VSRLSVAGRLWVAYFVVLIVGVVWVSSASAAINDAGWIDCGGEWQDCYAPGGWVRRGAGDRFVTMYRPVNVQVGCIAGFDNEYGSYGFGDMPFVTGDRCYTKPAEGTVYPADAGLGFVPGGGAAGYVTPLCLGGFACTGPDGESDPDPPADPASGATPGALAVDQSLTLLLAAVILFFVFHGYSVGSRR